MFNEIKWRVLKRLFPNTVFVRTNVHFLWKDKEGKVKFNGNLGSNIVTNAGKAQLALLAGASGTPFTYLALGTSSTAPAATDTTLGAEITDTGLARVAATVSRVTTSVTNDTLSLVGNWTASGVKALAELGMFNAASTGTMLGHKLVTSATTANGDSIQYTYTIQFS